MDPDVAEAPPAAASSSAVAEEEEEEEEEEVAEEEELERRQRTRSLRPAWTTLGGGRDAVIPAVAARRARKRLRAAEAAAGPSAAACLPLASNAAVPAMTMARQSPPPRSPPRAPARFSDGKKPRLHKLSLSKRTCKPEKSKTFVAVPGRAAAAVAAAAAPEGALAEQEPASQASPVGQRRSPSPPCSSGEEDALSPALVPMGPSTTAPAFAPDGDGAPEAAGSKRTAAQAFAVAVPGRRPSSRTSPAPSSALPTDSQVVDGFVPSFALDTGGGDYSSSDGCSSSEEETGEKHEEEEEGELESGEGGVRGTHLKKRRRVVQLASSRGSRSSSGSDDGNSDSDNGSGISSGDDSDGGNGFDYGVSDDDHDVPTMPAQPPRSHASEQVPLPLAQPRGQPPIRAQGQVDGAEGQWQCARCTLLNDARAGACDACEEPRIVGGRTADGGLGGEDQGVGGSASSEDEKEAAVADSARSSTQQRRPAPGEDLDDEISQAPEELDDIVDSEESEEEDEIIDLTGLTALSQMMSQVDEIEDALSGSTSRRPAGEACGTVGGAGRRRTWGDAFAGGSSRDDDEDIEEFTQEMAMGDAAEWEFAQFKHFRSVKWLEATGKSSIDFASMIQSEERVAAELKKFVGHPHIAITEGPPAAAAAAVAAAAAAAAAAVAAATTTQ